MRNERPIPLQIRFVAYFFLLCAVLWFIPLVNSISYALSHIKTVNFLVIISSTLSCLYISYGSARMYFDLITLKKESYQSAIGMSNWGMIGSGVGVFLLLIHIFHFIFIADLSTPMFYLFFLGFIVLFVLFTLCKLILEREEIQELFESQSAEMVRES